MCKLALSTVGCQPVKPYPALGRAKLSDLVSKKKTPAELEEDRRRIEKGKKPIAPKMVSAKSKDADPAHMTRANLVEPRAKEDVDGLRMKLKKGRRSALAGAHGAMRLLGWPG